MAHSAGQKKMIPAPNGSGLVVERTGEGPPVLLVHGLGGPAVWERVAAKLAKNYDVIVPHLAGFGESPATARNLFSDGHADLLRRVLEERHISCVTVAGISYGGMVAATLAGATPGLISSVVLICPTGTRDYPALVRSPIPTWFAGLVIKNILPRYPVVADLLSRRAFYDMASRPPDLVRRYLVRLSLPGHAVTLQSALHEITANGACLPGIVRTLTQPIHLVWGANDRTIPSRRAKLITAARPGIRFILVPESGHSLPLERPDEVCRVIEDAAAGGRASHRIDTEGADGANRGSNYPINPSLLMQAGSAISTPRPFIL